MKIIRNGVEIQLTAEETRLISEEYDLTCRKEDISSKIPRAVSDEELTAMASEVEKRLSKNDIYFEIIWDTVDDVITEHGYKK